MTEIYALLLTLLLGIFIVIGSLLVFLTKNNDNFIEFSLSLAFIVMLCLGIFDLLPEMTEMIGEYYNLYITIGIMVVSIFLGILILKILDNFVPHHHDHDCHHTKKEHIDNLFHIGIISSIALVIHNIIEGMALYSTSLLTPKTGIMMFLGIGLHNIPLGMVITSSIYKGRKKMKDVIITNIILFVSAFIGGLMMYLFNVENELILGILLSITFGMIIYITLFELLGRIIKAKNKQSILIGLLTGVLLFGLTFII